MESRRLYEEDHSAWLEYSIRQTKDIGLLEIADQLEELARSERRELKSWFIVLIHHMLKWKYQPKKRSKSWRVSIRNSRDQIGLMLQESPSLKPKAHSFAIEAYPISVRRAKDDTRLDNFPSDLEFSLDDLLDHDFFPDAL